ncbi:kinase-like domain-containing protein [Epithele typhae]|uniref:kinase-like domain-containing protein n=1 Tax=Epithele typhae TaxID=378194 RepID=UPI002008BF1C|nr:kinase-like domain-containing protein [Epithele typhae]KAH9940421.1 kinase-like domain-containing protein [Epithele typhae]
MIVPSSLVPDLSFTTLESGRYHLLHRLGAGSFGVVYAAVEYLSESSPAVPRAIKIIPAMGGVKAKALQQREIDMHTIVSDNEHVVTLHREFTDGQHVYLVMDYFEGGSLYDFMRRRNWTPIAGSDAVLKRMFLQILDGVAECHAKGVSHCDLKLNNILVSEDMSEVRLADFGLATSELFSSDFGASTPQFMCPGGGGVFIRPYNTQRNDIWALGVILLNLAVGRLLWQEASTDDVYYRAFCEYPEYLRAALPISAPLDALLQSVLTPNPSDTLSLAQFRAKLLAVDSFWMTPDELEAAYPSARNIWARYRHNLDSLDSLDSSSDYESESESDGEIDTDSDMSDSDDSAASSPLFSPVEPAAVPEDAKVADCWEEQYGAAVRAANYGPAATYDLSAATNASATGNADVFSSMDSEDTATDSEGPATRDFVTSSPVLEEGDGKLRRSYARSWDLQEFM